MTQDIQTLLEKIKGLKEENDWLGIYNIFPPIADLPQDNLIWKNHRVLNEIGYTCGKLAETSSIPQEIFKDSTAKDKFLKQQRKYREQTEMIRKQCIEIEPERAGYRADLAYLYYQSINELTEPRGRRDGNLREEIEKFIDAVDDALKLDPKRVNDLYRKGRILTDVLPNQILFSKSFKDYGDFAEKAKRVNEMREEGIQILLSAREVWESLNPDNHNEEFWRKRYRKDYIKSLYRLSQAYYDKIKEDWDESVFALNLRDDIPDDQQVEINQTDKENIEQAIQMIRECCVKDCPNHIQAGNSNLEQTAAHPGEHEGVDKLYSIGKLFFTKYWILSGYGLKETAEAIEARKIAERYLKAALTCQYSPQKANQHKAFIAERLARVFISKGEYNQATSIIAENIPTWMPMKDVQPYILHTSALSLLKAGSIELAQTILNSAAKSNRNMEPWLTHFLEGCAYLETDQIENARKQLNIAQQKAEQVGKKTIDSLLIAKASVAYKSGNVSEALKFLEEAQRLNPNRVAIDERIRKWQQHQN